MPGENSATLWKTSVYWSVPKCLTSRNKAMRKPKSPTRLVINAFFPAFAAESRKKKKPISR